MERREWEMETALNRTYNESCHGLVRHPNLTSLRSTTDSGTPWRYLHPETSVPLWCVSTPNHSSEHTTRQRRSLPSTRAQGCKKSKPF